MDSSKLGWMFINKTCVGGSAYQILSFYLNKPLYNQGGVQRLPGCMCGKPANKSKENWIKLNWFLTGLNACVLLRSEATGEDDNHTTLDTRRLFPTLVFAFLHLQFLPFYLNLIPKQHCLKLPGWLKWFFHQGQLTPFISWRTKDLILNILTS